MIPYTPSKTRAAARFAAIEALQLCDRLSGRMRRALAIPRVHILNLHHIMPHEREPFKKLLHWLQQTGHSFCSYSEAIHRIVSGDFDRPYVAFSFDDGIENCMAAADILKEYDATACYFINAKLVENTDAEYIREHCRVRMTMPPQTFLSWDQLRRIKQDGGEIGCHTYSHIDCAEAGPEELRRELADNKAALEERLGPVRHFAWPFGHTQYFSLQARDIVFESGFETCASAMRGAHVVQEKDTRFFIRREHVLAAWPLRHNAFFIARGARAANEHSGCWNRAFAVQG